VRPAGEELPGKWETGTKNHEGLAGVAAAIDYLAELGVRYGNAPTTVSRRAKLTAAWQAIGEYEQLLVERLIEGLEVVPGMRIYGITNRFDWPKRVATVSIRKEGTTPQQLAETLAAQNIFAWNGNFYAYEFSQRLGAEPSGGFLRLGLVHYNTLEEIDRCLRVLERM
jgi:selenocysteine lyase/cysteine desulfurase